MGPKGCGEESLGSSRGRLPYLAFELILQREVDEADAGVDQPVDEAHDVQPGLVLGGHHAHEDLAAQGLHAVFLLQHLPDPFFRTHKAPSPARTRPRRDTREPGDSRRQPRATHTDATPKSMSMGAPGGPHTHTHSHIHAQAQPRHKGANRHGRGEKTTRGTHQSGGNPWSRPKGQAPPSATASVHGPLGPKTP